MPKEYEITEFRKGDFQDQNGNYWCDMVLLGVGEPVKIVVKDPTKYEAGQKLFGTIEEKISKQNKPYKRFYKAKQEQQSFSNFGNSKSYEEGQAWGNAVSNATQLVINTLEPGKTLDEAIQLTIGAAEALFNGRNNKPASGYDFAKAKAEELRPDEEPFNLSDIPF